MHPTEHYDFHIKEFTHELKFFFISKGKKEVVKVVEYTYLQKFGQQHVYNLGFGDYDLRNNSIFDETNTNNGDAYKVFRTVLSIIPLFFERYPQAMLLVQGSDSTPEFLEHCLAVCRKNCHNGCKKFNQRISVYRNYVNMHYAELTKEYLLYGGQKDGQGKIGVEKYRRSELYGAIIIERNFINSNIVSEPEEQIAIMKKKEKTAPALSETELLAMLAEKFKGQVLFPRLVENAKKFLKDAEFVSE